MSVAGVAGSASTTGDRSTTPAAMPATSAAMLSTPAELPTMPAAMSATPVTVQHTRGDARGKLSALSTSSIRAHCVSEPDAPERRKLFAALIEAPHLPLRHALTEDSGVSGVAGKMILAGVTSEALP